MNVCVYTLGCRLNQAESEAIAESFRNNGYNLVKEREGVDFYIVNTCTVTSKAEQKARRMIRLFSQEAKAVLVTGCYAELNQEELEKLSNNIIVFSLDKKASLLKLADYLSSLPQEKDLKESLLSFSDNDTDPFSFKAASFTYHSRAYLKVQDGCDNNCLFCRVHIARGLALSLEIDEVIKRAKEIEDNGFNEIVLTGVNLTMYNHNKGGLASLLEKLLPALKETTRIRLSSLEPDHVDDKMIDLLADIRIHPYFHIPIQSASEKVLKRVNRNYPIEIVTNLIKRLREVKDNPFIAADIITGLPGEGEEEFLETVDFVKKNKLSAIHVFPFSPRPDTELFEAKDKVAERIRDERAKILRDISDEHTKEYLESQIGQIAEVLLEKRTSSYFTATSANYIKTKVLNPKPFMKRGDLILVRFEKLDGTTLVSSVL